MLTLLVLRQIGLVLSLFESLGPFGDVTHTHTQMAYVCIVNDSNSN